MRKKGGCLKFYSFFSLVSHLLLQMDAVTPCPPCLPCVSLPGPLVVVSVGVLAIRWCRELINNDQLKSVNPVQSEYRRHTQSASFKRSAPIQKCVTSADSNLDT